MSFCYQPSASWASPESWGEPDSYHLLPISGMTPPIRVT
ncbi:CRISPR-associated protein Cas5 [Metallosphaera yellowstonensis]